VIHGHSTKGGAVARLAALGRSAKAVYTPNGLRFADPALKRTSREALQHLERALAGLTPRLIAVSPEERAHLWQAGISPRKIDLVPNGIAAAPLPTQAVARQHLGLPLAAPVVGFVGRLSWQKHPEALLRAFELVRQAVPEARLAMIGDGPGQAQAEALAQSLGVAEAVHWLGPRPGASSMPAFDLFMLPSRYEGMPYVLLEALAAGLAIVTTEGAGASQLVEPGVNGEITPVESPKELGEAIVDLLIDADKRRAFGRASQRRSGHFTQQKMVEQTLAVYRQAVGRT
jgi:glycosyltransferase involved in cell wall biosynthesis